VSGTFVREIAMLGGDVGKFVVPLVTERLAEKLAARRQAHPSAGA
jgi:pantetheine-phosphate adenylyltransferase